MASIKVTFSIDVDEQRMKSMLTCAFEGGSNYWYNIDMNKIIYADGLIYADFQRGGKYASPDDYWHPLEIIPFTEGCALCIEDKDGDEEPHMLDRAKLIAGLYIMAEKFPKHFNDMVLENDDACTGDVYLQCCLFGDVIYG